MSIVGIDEISRVFGLSLTEISRLAHRGEHPQQVHMDGKPVEEWLASRQRQVATENEASQTPSTPRSFKGV